MAPENDNSGKAKDGASPGGIMPEGGDLTQSFDFFGDGKKGNDSLADELSDESDEDEEGEGEESEDDPSEEEGEESGEESDDDADEGDEVDEEPDDEEEGDESDEEEEEPQEKKVKKVKVKVGDEEIDLPTNAKIPTPVNGKIKHPTLQDLRNAFSSKENIAQTLQTVKQKEEGVEKKRREIFRKEEEMLAEKHGTETLKAQLKQSLEQGSFDQTINMLCFELGVDPANYWDRTEPVLASYFAGDGQNQGWAAMSPAERAAISNQRRVVLIQKQNAINEERSKFEKENQTLSAARTDILTKAGLSMEDIDLAFEQMNAEATAGKWKPEEVEDFKKKAPLDRFKLVAAHAFANKLKGKVTKVIDKSFPELKKRSQEVTELLERGMGPEFLVRATDKNIADLIRRVYAKGDAAGKGKTKSGGKSRSAKTSLSDKATPRHKVEKAATETDDDDDEDIYAQESGSRSSAVWGASFKTFA